MSSSWRIRTLDALIRGEPIDTVAGLEPTAGTGCAHCGRPNPELLGIRRFQDWLDRSGRMSDDGGSPWWREVNGALLLDMIDAPTTPVDASGATGSWANYWSSRRRRTATCWAAHQHSLLAASRDARAVLREEPPSERVFIAQAIESVRIASRAQLPTRRGGAATIAVFCRSFYPRSYPCDAAATGIRGALLDGLLPSRR